jgi:hypothetical protein
VREQHDWRELLVALVHGTCKDADVRAALAVVADNPLARVYAFHGDLLRALMEVPNAFWGRHPTLYSEYREVVRAGALARRDLPTERKEEFWSPLEIEE